MMFEGVGKSHIASSYFLHGQTLVEVILKAANLMGLKMMPHWPQMLSYSTTWKNFSVRLSA